MKKIYSLSDFKSSLEGHSQFQFKEEIVNDLPFTIISYMIITDFSMWSLPYAKECRGITFRSDTGELVALPFEKFFNLNENDESQEHLFKDQHFTFLEKCDGSMITPVLIDNNKIELKTKKSFYSDVALEAKEYWNYDLNRFSASLLHKGFTPIFEFTSPNSRIVIDYGEIPQFRVTACRSMQTGCYMNSQTLAEYCEHWGIPIVENWTEKHQIHTINQAKVFVSDAEEIEGTVAVSYDYQTRLKIKTQWYLDRHRIMTNLTERDVAIACVNETLDDIMPIIREYSDSAILRTQKIAEYVQQDLDGLLQLVYKIAEEQDRNQFDRKAFALRYKHEPIFPVAIQYCFDLKRNEDSLIEGIKKFWHKNYAKEFYSGKKTIAVFNNKSENNEE